MCWQCDHPEQTLYDYLDVLRATIRQCGWAVQYVEDDRAPYAYTIGLYAHGLPELVMTGLGAKRSARLLNHAAWHAVVGGVPEAGARFRLLEKVEIEVVDVEHPDAHLDMALAIANAPIRARQYVWADSKRRWPWAKGFDNGNRRQPVLGRRVAS